MFPIIAPINYQAIAKELAEKNYVVIDHFIPFDDSVELLALLNERKFDGAFRPAAIGKSGEKEIIQDIRSDQIHWLDENDTSDVVKAWFERVSLLSTTLKEQLFLPLKRFECHFAHYPHGTFYKKHIDAFRLSEGRLLSVIGYLTPNWQIGDGGELLIYDHTIQPASKQPVIKAIEPIMGRLVILRSDTVPHEVALSKTDRYSITGWLRQDELLF